MTPARLIASGLGVGFAPRAPGTAGSLLGLAIGGLLLARSRPLLAAGTVLAVAGGLWAIRAATLQPWRGTKAGAHDDPGWIVIDEVAGQMLALLALPRPSWSGPGWVGLLAAFALFRLFDITKPGPIGWADRQGGAAGIMADDILAGGAACLVLLAARLAMASA
jgi:phosphatidylglycerophosphatase A